MNRRHLYTVAPHAPFLPLLVERVLDGTLLNGWDLSGPFGLGDVTIILPTRRARLTLAELFAERLGGAALLPDIRTFGGDSAEEEPFLPPVDAPATPPAASPLERRLVLARLIEAFARSGAAFASPPNPAEIFWLADSLGALVDDFTIEDVDPHRLETIGEGEYAENWQDLLRFLRIALEAWPEQLRLGGKVDAAAARNARLRRQAATAPLLYGERPVIAAGSTGSIPATAELLGAIAALPRGAVVLPGLDTGFTPARHERLLSDAMGHGHPQYGLMRLLRALGAGIGDVEELAGESPRTTLVRAALSSADDTIGWPGARETIALDAALDGMSILAAANPDVEARAIALAARDGIARGASVGIVARDQTLARRIAAELRRHGIEPDDPAGTPLYQSGAARLARQVATAAASRFAPVDLVALLRNGAVTLGRDRADVRRLTNQIDFRIRGERVGVGLERIKALVNDEARALLDHLEARFAPLAGLLDQPRIEAGALAGAIAATLDGLTDGAELPGLVEFRLWAGELAAHAGDGPDFAPINLDAVLAALMEGHKVQSGERRRDDIFIWGELEARLMSPGLMILAGLNEDIWPAPADPGPWMSRAMKLAVGLEPPERRQGQAAHDFEMAVGNAEVILAYAQRVAGAPALPSRLLQRLDAFVGEEQARALRARGAHWVHQAEALDFAGRPKPASRPAPRPPAAIRPRRLSVTEIETLMRSPYDIYARHVLGLKRCEPLGAEPSARERGTMIHQVFERFVAQGLSFRAPDARDRMVGMAREAFEGLDAIGERRDIWLKRFERAADLFLEWERERQGLIAARAAESRGEWLFPTLENFVLSGKADRIDQRTDGLVEILDFKTGGVPEPGEMRDYEAPQLLLEAAMAQAGAFPGLPPRQTAALTYIKIGLGPAAFEVRPFRLRPGVTVMQAADEIARRTQGHIAAFLLAGDLPMPARIRPRPSTGRRPRPGDYDHLARTDEWTLTAGVDDP